MNEHFVDLGSLFILFFFKSLPLTLLLVAKSLGEYQYKFQGKTPARKYPFLCSSSPSLAKLSKGKKKKVEPNSPCRRKIGTMFCQRELGYMGKQVYYSSFS
jgi:hypothetical protein